MSFPHEGGLILVHLGVHRKFSSVELKVWVDEILIYSIHPIKIMATSPSVFLCLSLSLAAVVYQWIYQRWSFQKYLTE